MVRNVTCSPLYAGYDRHQGISREKKSWDCVFLACTQHNAELDYPSVHVQLNHHWGIRRGQHTTNGCG
eukprot:4178157-Pyramimonas_sp.AAC.1